VKIHEKREGDFGRSTKLRRYFVEIIGDFMTNLSISLNVINIVKCSSSMKFAWEKASISSKK